MWMFLLSKAKIINRFYPVVLSLTFHVKCGFNLGILFVINLIIFCVFFLVFIPC